MASIQTRETATGKVRHAVLYRHNGKQTSLTFLKKRDAEKARDLINALGPDEALERIYGPTRTGDAPTLAEWIEKHIADLTGVTERTRADYRKLAARHIVPTLGALDIDEVTVADISKWANGLERAGMSDKSIANLRALLSSVFGYAVDEGLRTDNPMRRLRRSRASEHEKAEMVFLTAQEFSHLRSLIRERWRPFVTFLAGSGLRFGEAIALEVADVDLLADTPVVRVTKAWKRIPGGFEVGPPKSRASRRTVDLSRDVVEALIPLVAGRDGREILFVGRDGRRVSHSHFHRWTWLPAVKQFEAETGKRPRIHDLRHTHASLCIERGMHLESIRDRLGHESITTTQIYSHLSPQQRQLNAAMLNGLFADERI
jgi:integrase